VQAVCQSKKSWQARHTGIKIVQQISILLGCAVLPHLKSLVEIIDHGLVVRRRSRVCVWSCMYVCVCVVKVANCVWSCMYVCVYVCVCVCVCV